MGGISIRLKALRKEKIRGGSSSGGHAPDAKKDKPRASPQSSANTTPSPSSSPPSNGSGMLNPGGTSTAAGPGAPRTTVTPMPPSAQPIGRYGRDQIIRCHVLDYKSTPGQQAQLISDPEDCLI